MERKKGGRLYDVMEEQENQAARDEGSGLLYSVMSRQIKKGYGVLGSTNAYGEAGSERKNGYGVLSNDEKLFNDLGTEDAAKKARYRYNAAWPERFKIEEGIVMGL